MLSALALSVLFSTFQSASPGIEFQDFQGDPGFAAKIDGKDRTVVLATRWPTSYLLGGDGVHTVALGGKPLVTVPFMKTDKATMYPDAHAVLGVDALRKVCLAFDTLWNRMEVLPAPKIGLAGAKAYFAKLPAWEGATASVVKIPLARALDGAPIVRTTVAGNPTSLVLTLSAYNNMLDRTVKGAPLVKSDDWSHLPGVGFPGLSPRWLAYATLDGDWNARREGGHGILSLDAFGSRRVIVDLADDAVYVEELSEEARLSMFLSSRATMPLVVKGDAVAFAPLPGLWDDDNIGENEGSRVLRMAGEPIADWLKDLRAGTPEAADRLTRRLKLMEDDYDLDLAAPDGTTRTVTIPGRGRPGDAAG